MGVVGFVDGFVKPTSAYTGICRMFIGCYEVSTRVL